MSSPTDTTCTKCGDAFADDEPFMTCCDCSGCYQLGTCSEISESTFKSKGDEYKRSWRCPQCRKSRSGNIFSKETEESTAVMLAEINRKLDALLPLKYSVSEIEQSTKLISDKYDSVLANVAKQDSEIKNLKSRVCKLEKADASGEVQSVSAALNDLEFHSRKLNVEIHGIKEKEDECLLTEVNVIASKLGIDPLTEQTVCAIHRLPLKIDKIPAVIVRFTNRATRDKWLEKRKLLSTLKLGPFMIENLTTQNRVLLRTTKELSRENNFRFVWHRGGNVLVRTEEGNRAHLIRKLSDLEKLTE